MAKVTVNYQMTAVFSGYDGNSRTSASEVAGRRLNITNTESVDQDIKNYRQYQLERCQGTIYRQTNTQDIEVIAEKPKDVSIRDLKRNPLAIEQFLTDARIPEIIKCIEGQTIIYTEYITEVIPKLRRAIADAGYKFTEYTGSFRDLKPFLNKQVQVLIASKPISIEAKKGWTIKPVEVIAQKIRELKLPPKRETNNSPRHERYRIR